MLIGDGGHASVIRSFWDKSTYWVIAVGDNRARKKEAEANVGMEFGIAWHPHSYVSDGCSIGFGTVIMAGVIIQANCKIGKHVILNTNCSIDHDCIIGDYAHIAPGATLCGNVTVGEGALVGVNVGIAPGAIIPPWSLVRAARLDIVPLPDH